MAKKKLKRKNPCTACAATTLAGNPCKGKPVGRSKYCMSHSKKAKSKRKKNPCGSKHKPKKKNPCGSKRKPKKKSRKLAKSKKKMRRKLRKNPGFSFKDGKAIKHDVEHDELYARIPPRHNPGFSFRDGEVVKHDADLDEMYPTRGNPMGMCPSCLGTGFRRNPGVQDSLSEMGLSYGYSKPRRRFRVRRRRHNPYW